MAEGGHDLLKVMGDQDHRRAAGRPAQAFKGRQELLSGNEVQAAAGFIQNQETRLVNERPGDQEALLFSMGEHRVGKIEYLAAIEPCGKPGGFLEILRPRACRISRARHTFRSQ